MQSTDRRVQYVIRHVIRFVEGNDYLYYTRNEKGAMITILLDGTTIRLN